MLRPTGEEREVLLARSMKPSLRKLCRALLLTLGTLGVLTAGAAAISWTPYPLPPVGNIIGQFNDVIFDGSQFWAVGANGWVQKSPDGATWTSVAPGPTYFFYDIAHGGGGQYVVVGAGGGGGGSTVYVTNDGGTTWTQSTTGVPTFWPLYNVAHGATAGEYVAVGGGGTIVRSTDGGVTWSPPTVGPQNFTPPHYWDLNNVIYAPIGTGLYVAVGGGGTILTSSDGGNTWTPQSSGTSVVLENVTYANGLLVAVGWNGTILTSTNGVSWTQVSPAPTTKNLSAVTYGPCGWVATGVQGTVLSSPTGTTWSVETSNTTAALLGVTYGNNRYVAVGQGATLVGQCAAPAGAPDLQIVKRAVNTPWPVGGTGSFAISVTNVGNAALPGSATVTVTENLPAGLTLTGASGSGWTCTPTSGAGPLPVTCTYTVPAGGLAAGGNLPPINITVKVDSPGPHTNCARVSGTLQGAVLQEQTGNNWSCVDIPTSGSVGGDKCTPLPSGAVAWWPLNETAGATAVNDLVGGHTGTPMSGPVGSGGPSPTAGMVGGALYVTSQGTYVRVPDSPALNFGSGDFTIDAWVNPVQVGPSWFQPIVDKAQAVGAPGGAQGYRLYVKNGKVIFVLADGSTTALVSAPVTYGTWQFVVAQRAGGALKLYVNGALAATATLPSGFGSVSNTADLLVGGITAVGTPVKPIIGEIGLDEVELFSRALTAQEVQAIYNAGPAGKCPPQPVGKPDLTIEKKPTGPLVAGQQGSYQIVVSNVGAVPAPGPIVVTDTLGAGLTYVSASGSGWNCSASGQTVTCTHPGPVPPGGALPPITLTVQVAADAQEVKNCARVKALEQPADFGMGMPEVLLPDADPANNEACDVSPVGQGEKPGMICGVKFLDHDGDGVRDANEPGLPKWTIQVKDAAGNAVGTSTTGKKGRYCIEVKPGTYTVSEVAQPGWVQTAPPPVPPGTATVTVAAGQTVNVLFGNRPEKKPCCLTFTLQGGKDDGFSTADGAAAEPANPVPNGPAAWSGSYFDQAQYDRAFAHRFILPEGNCLRAAKLEVRAKPMGGQTQNDRIYLYSPFGSAAQWVANFGSASGNAGGADLLLNPWTTANYGGGQTFTLDLAALPLPSSGTTSLLAALNLSRILDLAVQDDSSVDFARLTVTFCECAQGETAALGAEARGGASEVRLTIGRPVLLSDGLDREIDVPPVIRGGRTFLPVRALAEALGLEVAWDPAERKVTLTRPIEDPPLTVELWIGKAQATVAGSGGAKLTKADAARGIEKKDIWRVAIDPANPEVAPFIENGRVMLPVRFIAEALDLDVSFEPAAKRITIKTKSPPR